MEGSRRPDDIDNVSTRAFSVDHVERPWFLKRWVLALWGVAVLILIATIIYGLAILARGNGGNIPPPVPTRPPTTTSSSRTMPTSPIPSSTLPITTTTEPQTTPEPAPQPTQAPYTPQHPWHRWWRSNLPPLPPIPHF